MALRPEEILRIKFELGVSVTLIGAEPYITYLAVFDRAIQPYIIDPATTSTTTVQAGTSTAITLAAIPVIAGTNLPAFTVGTSVAVDVGPAAETVTIALLSGNVITATFANAHGVGGAAYPVQMSGGEAVVREILARIATITAQLNTFAPQSAGVEQIDEIKLYPATTSGSRRGSRDMFESLIQQREQSRNDLGEAVGFPNLRTVRKQSTGAVSPY